jgi:hypothetical protein
MLFFLSLFYFLTSFTPTFNLLPHRTFTLLFSILLKPLALLLHHYYVLQPIFILRRAPPTFSTWLSNPHHIACSFFFSPPRSFSGDKNWKPDKTKNTLSISTQDYISYLVRTSSACALAVLRCCVTPSISSCERNSRCSIFLQKKNK